MEACLHFRGAAFPMHQHSRALNFTPSLLLALSRLLTSKVLVNVTIGIGELIQSSNASALFVSCGFTAVFIIYIYFIIGRKVLNTILNKCFFRHHSLFLGWDKQDLNESFLDSYKTDSLLEIIQSHDRMLNFTQCLGNIFLDFCNTSERNRWFFLT